MPGNNSTPPTASAPSTPYKKLATANPSVTNLQKESKLLSPRPLTPYETKEGRKDKAPLRFEDLTSQDQLVLVQELESSLIYFLERGLPIYLDGLGILFPIIKQRRRVKNLRDKFVLYSEDYRTVGFEKCYELVSFNRERFSGVLESRDIAHRVYARGMPFLSTPFSEVEVRRLVRGIIDKIRVETVTTGRSYLLSTIGDFFALHNRQGETFTDWYAGADIFLKTSYQKILKTTPSKFFARPVFNDSKEPFTALYGSPLNEFSIDLAAELVKLGYEISETEKKALTPSSFSVAVFSSKDSEKSGAIILTYVTDGLRAIGIEKNSSEALGSEFVVQTVLEPKDSMGRKGVVSVEAGTLPIWPVRMMTAGWILLKASKSGRVKPGAGLAVGRDSLFANEASSLTTVLTAKFPKIAGEQLSPEGAFEYISLIAISSDEAEVASKHSPHLLLTLLDYKKLQQITKPGRSSLVAKTGFLSSELSAL